MVTVATKTDRIPPAFSGDDERWEAVVRRDRAADGVFYYAVRYHLPRRQMSRIRGAASDDLPGGVPWHSGSVEPCAEGPVVLRCHLL
jgi:hypothetical protein